MFSDVVSTKYGKMRHVSANKELLKLMEFVEIALPIHLLLLMDQNAFVTKTIFGILIEELVTGLFAV